MIFELYTATYSRTLLEVAQEKGELEEVRGEVEMLLQLFAGEPRLQLFLESPRAETSDKLSVVEAVLHGKVSETLYRFVRLVIDKDRAEGLHEILTRFLSDHDRLVGRVKVDVTTAVTLEEDLVGRLRESLERGLEKTVVVESSVDEDILGGIVVRFEGMVADASLKRALDRLQVDMLAPRLGSELVHED